jgi:hypothetical protein
MVVFRAAGGAIVHAWTKGKARACVALTEVAGLNGKEREKTQVNE